MDKMDVIKKRLQARYNSCRNNSSLDVIKNRIRLTTLVYGIDGRSSAVGPLRCLCTDDILTQTWFQLTRQLISVMSHMVHQNIREYN
jgi:hypothetical protein